MAFLFAWCAGPAAAHATLVLPHPPADAPDVAHLRAAREAVSRGDLEGALAHFDEAIHLSPGLGVAHLGRAVCLAAMRRGDEARASLEAGLASGATGPDLALQLSRVAAREGNAPLAMELLGHALRSRPDAGEGVLADPAYRAIRDHPRLLAMLGRI